MNNEEEITISQEALDAAEFIALVIQKSKSGLELVFEMVDGRPSWRILVPFDYQLEDVDEAMFKLITEVYLQRGILVTYILQQMAQQQMTGDMNDDGTVHE